MASAHSVEVTLREGARVYQGDRIVHTATIQRDASLAEALKKRGLLHIRLKRHREALSDFPRVLKLQPADAEAYYFRSTVYRAIGDPSGALDDLNAAIRLDPKNSSYISTLKEVRDEVEGRN
ncbi:tetratricopeptide repeat protein [bacterium]|nr:tetratricopeptide repeat protein [bacterium]